MIGRNLFIGSMRCRGWDVNSLRAFVRFKVYVSV